MFSILSNDLMSHRFLTRQERAFLDTVQTELESFCGSSKATILIFPCLAPKLRFLIHQFVSDEYGDRFGTLSIGKDFNRRIVVYCRSSHRSRDMDLPETSKDGKKQKRPDKPLYQPPKSKPGSSDASEKSSPVSPDETSWDALYDDNGDLLLQQDAGADPIGSLSSHLGPEPIRPDQVARVETDYSRFNASQRSPISSPEPGSPGSPNDNHILEIHGFSADLKTRDLISCLSFNFKNFEIDWVDDTHALVMFQNAGQASEALNRVYPIMKLRSLSQATELSRMKAKKLMEKGMTRKMRPETSALTARRLVIGALGIKVDIDPERRQAEREKLRLAKEKKERSLRQTKSIWNDDLP